MKSRGEISENSIKIKTCSGVSSKNLHDIHSVFSVVRPPAAEELGLREHFDVYFPRGDGRLLFCREDQEKIMPFHSSKDHHLFHMPHA